MPPTSRQFVADPTQGSRHNRGAAVDLTLYSLTTGKPVVTTGRYDEFSDRSHSNFVRGLESSALASRDAAIRDVHPLSERYGTAE